VICAFSSTTSSVKSHTQGAGDGAAARRAVAPSPSLSISNNSTEGTGDGVNRLTGMHKRTAQVIFLEVKDLARRFGLEKLGFLTLTFADHVLEIREAQRRFNSLNTHVLRGRYRRAVAVVERQKSGRVHFHLVVVLNADIRTGFDFGQAERGIYTSASPALRAEWAFWRNTAKKYGFGRTELLPVKSTVEGIARYVGKYLAKHVRQRSECDKGARVVRFLGYKSGDRTASPRFSWNTENGWLWRHKLKAFCHHYGLSTTDTLKEIFGSRWCFFLQHEIMGMTVTDCHPSKHCAEMSLDAKAGKYAAMAAMLDLQDRRVGNRTYLLRPGRVGLADSTILLSGP